MWDPAYVSSAASTISTTKAARVIELAQAEGLVKSCQAPFHEDEAWADIATVHDPAYVAAVQTGEPRRLAESQGFRWSPAFAASVARIWSGHAWACRLALTEGLVLHPVSGAHHAGRATGGGYCTFNFLVGAARRALPRFLDRVRPGLVQYQAGMDPFEDDPVGGIDDVTKTFLAWRDRFVLRELRARGIPTVVNLAGGYIPEVTAQLHVQTIRIAARAMGVTARREVR